MPVVNTGDIAELVQERIQNLLITPLEEASSFLSTGPRIFDTSTPITVPKMSGSFSPDWVGESEEIPEDDGVEFDSVPLLPSSMKSIKSLIRLSNESLRMSSQSLDSLLQARLVKDVQTKLDGQFWGSAGDGTSTPKGALHADHTAGMISINLAGAPVELDTLHDALGEALADDVPLGSLRWVMSPAMLTSLRKVKADDGRYILTEDVSQSPGGLRLLGSSVVLTKKLAPAATGEHLLLMTPSSYGVARDLSPQVTVLRERYAEFDEVGLRIVTRWDLASLQPEANVLISNAAPAAESEPAA